MTYRYKIESCRVIDGDSVEVIFLLGFRLSFKQICRLAHINAPEMNAGGEAAKLWLSNKIGVDMSVFEVETTKSDKYGRYLVDIYRRTEFDGWESVNQTMIQLGLAVPYEGGKR